MSSSRERIRAYMMNVVVPEDSRSRVRGALFGELTAHIRDHEEPLEAGMAELTPAGSPRETRMSSSRMFRLAAAALVGISVVAAISVTIATAGAPTHSRRGSTGASMKQKNKPASPLKSATCRAAQLRLQLASNYSEASNSFLQPILIENKSNVSCHLGGWPEITAISASNKLVSTTTDFLRRYRPSLPRWQVVQLAPGQSASFAVSGESYNAAQNLSCPKSSSWLIRLPSVASPIIVPARRPACGEGTGLTFNVTPLLRGTSIRQMSDYALFAGSASCNRTCTVHSSSDAPVAYKTIPRVIPANGADILVRADYSKPDSAWVTQMLLRKASKQSPMSKSQAEADALAADNAPGLTISQATYGSVTIPGTASVQNRDAWVVVVTSSDPGITQYGCIAEPGRASSTGTSGTRTGTCHSARFANDTLVIDPSSGQVIYGYFS